jgi:hypothetical protein
MINKQSVSSPIPIPLSKNAFYRNVRQQRTTSTRKTQTSPINNPILNNVSPNCVVSSAPVAVNNVTDIIDFDCVDDSFYSYESNYVHHCTPHDTVATHLVNGLNVSSEVLNNSSLFVFCDCPKIKDVYNILSYHILESKKGILAFTTKQHIESLKRDLNISFNIVEIQKEDLIYYNQSTKTKSIVIYNSYSDTDTKSSYYLYYNIE